RGSWRVELISQVYSKRRVFSNPSATPAARYVTEKVSQFVYRNSERPDESSSPFKVYSKWRVFSKPSARLAA
ncbi:hypothetical protein DXG01_015777, partial [Tephrocybe rancida]